MEVQLIKYWHYLNLKETSVHCIQCLRRNCHTEYQYTLLVFFILFIFPICLAVFGLLSTFLPQSSAILLISRIYFLTFPVNPFIHSLFPFCPWYSLTCSIFILFSYHNFLSSSIRTKCQNHCNSFLSIRSTLEYSFLFFCISNFASLVSFNIPATRSLDSK